MNLDNNTIQIKEFLKRVPIFEHLTDEESDFLSKRMLMSEYAKGEVIFKKNNFPSCIYIVIKGTVKEIAIDANDFSTVVNTHREGDYIGETGVILEEPYFSSALAVTKTKVLKIQKEHFSEIVYGNKKVLQHIIRVLSQRLQHSAERIISFLEFNSEGCVAYRLLAMSNKKKVGDPLQIKITQENLSQVCGIARQTVSIILNKWKFDNIVKTHRGYIEIVDKSMLISIFLDNTTER